MNTSETAVEPNRQPVYEFDGFRLDKARRELRAADGRLVHLTARALDTLICFLEHGGGLLTKDVLMKAVWPDSVVEENNLNQAIAVLRRALGEKRGEPRFVMTEPGRGYRFIAEIHDVTPQRPASTRRDVLPGSVAVLPFENLSPDPAHAFFAAGVHDEIINRLSQVQDLNVIARRSVLQYAGGSKSVPEIAAELRVEVVLEGSLRYAENRIRCTAQLINGETGTHAWSGAYDGDLEDVFTIQTEIASAIALALEARLLPAEQSRLEKPLTRSPAAYALFLEAGHLINRMTGEHEARLLLDRAIALDPDFAMAHALKAYRCACSLVNSTTFAPRNAVLLQEMERNALADADHALGLDEGLGLAWAARGMVNRIRWRWRSASEAFDRAMALSPNDVDVLRECASFKTGNAEPIEALRLLRKQATLNPNDRSSHIHLGGLAGFAGAFEAALPSAEKARDLSPGDVFGVALLAYTHLGRKDIAAATPLLKTAEQLMTDDTGHHMPALIYGFGLAGLRDDAAELFRRYQIWAESRSAGAGDWTLAYLGTGRLDLARKWFGIAVERAGAHEIDAGFWATILVKLNVHSDPALEQPRFRMLRERLGAIAGAA